MKPTIVCMVLAVVCMVGCDIDWPGMTTPMKAQPEVVNLVEVPEVDEVLCNCPDEAIVIRIKTPRGMEFYIIPKGDFNDIDNNPNTMYWDDFEELRKRNEDSNRKAPEQNEEPLKVEL